MTVDLNALEVSHSNDDELLTVSLCLWKLGCMKNVNVKKVKVKVLWAIKMEKLHDTATECHLPYGITQCYLLPDTSEHTPPSPLPDRLVLDLPTI